MDEAEIKARLTALKPLRRRDVRKLYERAPSPEMAVAVWEIKRLQRLVIESFLRFERGTLHPDQAQHYSHMGCAALVDEPCVFIRHEEDWRNRHIPESRYFRHRGPSC